MTENLQKTIEEQVGLLPREMQEAVKSFDWVKIAEEIGTARKMETGEIEDFQLETLLVLIGVVDAESYARNIENQVGTTQNEAQSLAKEGFEKIFAPLRKKIEENIKKNLPGKKADWKQSLDFVLSGGDYTAFLQKPAQNLSSGNTVKMNDIKFNR